MVRLVTFDEVMARWDWHPIPGCPGRYKQARIFVSPTEIVGADLPVERHKVSVARDVVLVVRLDGGGLISYEQEDGSFVHTLGDEEGFERKLTELGI